MNIKQLEYFISVAEKLSFTKAAEDNYISQTAITQQIKALETQLDTTLFKRSKRHVELTSAGNFFLTEAREIVNHINTSIYKTKEFSNGLVGTLSLGIIVGYEKGCLTEYLKNFVTLYPKVSVDVYRDGMTELLDSIKKNTLDIAFVINPEIHPLSEFNYKTIGRYSLAALLPLNHHLALRKSINLNELKNDNFIFVKETGDEYGQKEMVQDRYREAGFVPKIIQRCNDFNTIVLMIAANMGVAVIPTFAITNSDLSKNISIVPLDGDTDRIEVVAVWNKENTNPSLRNFINLI